MADIPKAHSYIFRRRLRELVSRETELGLEQIDMTSYIFIAPRFRLILVRACHYRQSTTISEQNGTTGVAPSTAAQVQNGTGHLLVTTKPSGGNERRRQPGKSCSSQLQMPF